MVSVCLPCCCVLNYIVQISTNIPQQSIHTWCFWPGLVTLLAAVGRVFPWRFFAPHDALARKEKSWKMSSLLWETRMIGSFRAWPILAAHVELLCSSCSLKCPLFLLHFYSPPKRDSEIQLAVRECHSSLILWPISQCWWWCIINISINQAQLGISTDWISLRQKGKKIKRSLKSRHSVVFFTFHLFVSVHYFHFWIWVQLGRLKRGVLKKKC